MRCLQVFFCGDLTKASELVENGHSHPEEFSIFMGASTWDVSTGACFPPDVLTLLPVGVNQTPIFFSRESA